MKLKTMKSYWQQDFKKVEIGIAFLKGILLIGGISILFYNSFFMMIALFPLLILYLKEWRREYILTKSNAFQLEFKEGIQAISVALSAGYSVENSMRVALKDLELLYDKGCKIIKEFTHCVYQLEMNIPIEKVLREFADRIGEEDVYNFVTVFIVAKRTGGNSVIIIQNTVRNICEKIEISREIDTLMSAKKFEFKVMSAIPFGIICYLRLSFPDFTSALYGNLVGIVVMTVCLIVYLFAFWMGRKIVEIEV